jgi:hypothetical protein
VPGFGFDKVSGGAKNADATLNPEGVEAQTTGALPDFRIAGASKRPLIIGDG